MTRLFQRRSPMSDPQGNTRQTREDRFVELIDQYNAADNDADRKQAERSILELVAANFQEHLRPFVGTILGARANNDRIDCSARYTQCDPRVAGDPVNSQPQGPARCAWAVGGEWHHLHPTTTTLPARRAIVVTSAKGVRGPTMNQKDNASRKSADGIGGNVQKAMGIPSGGDPGSARNSLWPETIQAIEEAGIQLRGQLGKGSFGVVYEAVEPTGRRVARKVLLRPHVQSDRNGFKRECLILASESAPRDVMPQFHGVHDPPNGQPFLLMELLDGGMPIHEYVEHGRPWPQSERLELLERLLRDVHRLHESNIVHRDIKSDHVMVMPGGRMRLLDFGQSGRLEAGDASLSSLRGPKGTPGFATDKLLDAEGRGDRHDDVYSVAAVGFHLLSGNVPIKPSKVVGETAEQRQKKLAEFARHWRRELLEKQALVLACVVTLLLVVLLPVAWTGWARLWSEREASDTRRIAEVQREVDALPHRDHQAVQRLQSQVDATKQQRQQALDEGRTSESAKLAREAVATLQRAIQANRDLDQVAPLQDAVGTMRAELPWVTNAPEIQQRLQLLNQQHLEAGLAIERGDLDEALKALTVLQKETAQLAAANVLAAQADARRKEYQRLADNLTPRLRELGGFQDITLYATQASQAWDEGKWDQSRDLYGHAQQVLEKWLDANETPDELAKRKQASQEVIDALESEKQQLQVPIDQLTQQGDERLEQIAELTKQWLGEQKRAEAMARQAAEANQTTEQLREAERTRFSGLQQELTGKDVEMAVAKTQYQTELSRLKTVYAAELASRAEALAAASKEADATAKQLEYWKAAAAQGDNGEPLELLDKAAPQLLLTTTAETVENSIGMKFVLIPRTETPFMMGSPESETDRDDDEHQHLVRITYDFLMGVDEVTQGQIETILGRNPSRFSESDTKKDSLPVDSANWYDAIEMANELSKHEKLDPYYELTVTTRNSNKSIDVATVRILGGNGYRLPTEAEWEYAARAGSTTTYPWGDTLNGNEANVDGSYPYGTSTKGPHIQRTVPVGSYKPNAWGLYDTVGNVWEWCFDAYEDDFYESSKGAAENPSNAKMGDMPRVLRGGGWFSDALSARSAYRDGGAADSRVNVGLRLARTP